MAGGKGFEPLQANPESAVLPLDEPPLSSNGQYFNTAFALCPGLTNAWPQGDSQSQRSAVRWLSASLAIISYPPAPTFPRYRAAQQCG